MATTRQREGKTPNGGVRSVIYFQDDEGRLVDEEVATHAEIVELDAEGKQVGRTYGTIGRSAVPKSEG